MDFIETDMVHEDEEMYEVADDCTLVRLPNPNGNSKIRSINQRSTHNKENVCHNVVQRDRMPEILESIGPDDDVQLFSHFFKVVEETENKDIIAKCLGCDKPYKAKSGIPSNLVTHLKVCCI